MEDISTCKERGSVQDIYIISPLVGTATCVTESHAGKYGQADMLIRTSDKIRSLTGNWLSKLDTLIQGKELVHSKLQSVITSKDSNIIT